MALALPPTASTVTLGLCSPPPPVLLALRIRIRVLPGENSLGPSCFRASAAAWRHPSCIVSQSVRSLVVRIRLSRCEPEPLLQATAPLAPTDNPRPHRRPGQVYRMYQYYVPLGLQASVLSPERLGRDFIIMGAPLRDPDASIWPASDATSSRSTHLTAASAQGRVVRCGSCANAAWPPGTLFLVLSRRVVASHTTTRTSRTSCRCSGCWSAGVLAASTVGQ